MSTIFRNPSPPPPKEKEPVKELNEKVADVPGNEKKNPPIQPVKATQVSHVSPSYSKLQSEMLNSEKSDFARNSDKKAAVSSAQTKEKLPKGKAAVKVEETRVPISRKEEKRSISVTAKKGSDSDDDEWRKEFLPDRSKADFYCDICDAHMNSEQMWENHVQGKRHLKNLKKEPGEPISKIRSVKQDRTPQLKKRLDKVSSPIVGLDFLSELQRAEPHLEPSYTCFLCHATCTTTSVIDHILGCKHRLAYLREVSPDEFALVENLDLKKSALTSLAEEYATKLELEKGRGKMEVKLEKPKMAPPPPSNRRDKRYLDDDYDSEYYSKRSNSGRPGPWRRDHDRDSWSPEPSMPSIPQLHPVNSAISSNVQGMPTRMKLDLLHQLSNIIVVSETEAKSLMAIINALTQSLLQFKIRNLPPGIQDMLAKHIISGDTRSLENALGLGGSGVANVNNVLNSMATAGELSGRSGGGGSGIVWPPHQPRTPPMMPVRSTDGIWSGPGPRGIHSSSYASPHWHGSMSTDGFRRADRSTFGC